MQRQKEPKSTSTLIDAQGSHQDLKKTYHLKWTQIFIVKINKSIFIMFSWIMKMFEKVK